MFLLQACTNSSSSSDYASAELNGIYSEMDIYYQCADVELLQSKYMYLKYIKFEWRVMKL